MRSSLGLRVVGGKLTCGSKYNKLKLGVLDLLPAGSKFNSENDINYIESYLGLPMGSNSLYTDL
jgi:hypothetical protein